MNSKRKFSGLLIITLSLLVLCACTSFVNSTRKTLYATATLADGSMRGYATWWKDATNRPAYYGTSTEALLVQRSNVLVLSRRVGAGIAAVNATLTIYQTNTAAKPQVVSALGSLITDSAQLAGAVFTATNGPTGRNLQLNVIK